MIRWRDTVRFKDLRAETLLAIIVAAEVFWPDGDLWVTSANDGVHKGKPVANEGMDPHYTGRAFDLSIKVLSQAAREIFVSILTRRLGPEYVVLWESKGTPNEHVHVQYGRVGVA